MRDKLNSALKEPLLHFLLAGLALFLFSAWRGESDDSEGRTITITEAQVIRLAASWEQTWRRPPTSAEIDGLIRDHIKEEIYYREALRLGLDQDDIIVRRRMRSKMEFLIGSQLENETPQDAALEAFLQRNRHAYANDTRYSFDQVYLAAGDEATTSARASRLLADLRGGADWRELGDPITLPVSSNDAYRKRIATDFGDEFAAALPGLELGRWQGPIASGFGLHLVRVRAARAGTVPKLADVRPKVEYDWRAATIKTREDKAYQALLSSYKVKIAQP